MHLLRQTPVATPATQERLFRGVYDIDPADFPPPPPGAKCVMNIDSQGVVIGAGWAIEKHSDDMRDRAWNWLDERDRPVLSPLRLVPP